MEAVKLYLDEVFSIQGEAAMQRGWERIWTGFLAFRQGMKGFDATLEKQATVRFLGPLIRQNWQRHKILKKQRKSAPVS